MRIELTILGLDVLTLDVTTGAADDHDSDHTGNLFDAGFAAFEGG